MSTTEPSHNPDTFVISLPTGWIEVPLDPDELVAKVRARAEDQLPPGQSDAIEFGRLLVLLRRVAEQALQGGVVFAAASGELVEPTGDDAVTDAPYFLTAIAWIATMRAEEFGTEHIFFEQLQAAVDPEPTDDRRRRAERPRVVDLRAGPAVRDVTLQQVALSGTDGDLDVLECRYHMLIGEGAGMAVLGFSTPNTELAEEMLELFHAVAETLEFVAA